MRLSSIVLVMIAALMGLGAAALAVNWLDMRRPAAVATLPTKDAAVRKVVVASHPLRFGTEITLPALKEVEWPVGAVPSGAFLSVSDLTKAGERRVALAAIEKDEPILAWKITGPGQRASLSAVIGSDKTAMTIRVNDVSGAAGFVLPGDRVDVLLTRTEDKGGFNDVLLQNVRALAVDQLADERSEKPSVVKAVTLEVTIDEAQRLALASTVGQLSLALRPAGAVKEAATRRVGMFDLGDRPSPKPVEFVVERAAPEEKFTPPLAPIRTVVGITRAVERKEYTVRPDRR